MKPSWLFSVNGVLDGFHGISCLWSIPWVFIQVIPILFTFGLCNITSSRYSECISDLYILFFSISLNTNIILLEDSFSLLSLYLLLVYDPISWMEKSPRFYRFLKLCNSCLRLLILQIHFFLPLSTSTVLTTSKGVDDVSVKISRVPQKKI